MTNHQEKQEQVTSLIGKVVLVFWIIGGTALALLIVVLLVKAITG